MSFEKQFLTRDDKRIEGSKQDYQNVLDKYTAVLPNVEKAIGQKLTDAQVIDIVARRDAAVIDIVKPKFQFPAADIAFNLQALGLNLDDILSELRNMSIVYSGYKLDNGKLVLTDEFIAELIEQNTRYTQNENQNKALDLAKRFEALFDEADEMGVLDKWSNKNQIGNVLKVVHSPLGARNIVPNHYFILDIRE